MIYISLLRGINVGGKNSIKMDLLRELYTELGFTEVKSYIQSGNLIFRYSNYNSDKLGNLISNAIFEKFGFNVYVLVITADEFKFDIVNNPFYKHLAKNSTFIHFTFLSEKPANDLVSSIKLDDFNPDECVFFDKMVYLYCPNGYSKTKLTNPYFERKLKLSATTRNFKTVLELESMLDNFQK